MVKKANSNGSNYSLNTRQAANAFKKAASAYSVKATKTKASANSALVTVGTHTPRGNLRKHYK
jgi:hypothetical protein